MLHCDNTSAVSPCFSGRQGSETQTLPREAGELWARLTEGAFVLVRQAAQEGRDFQIVFRLGLFHRLGR